MEELYTFDETYQKLLGIDLQGAEIGGIKIQGVKNAIPMSEILNLSGKVAIVTGGSRGLGLCIVNRLCEAGARVVIADIAVDFAEAAVQFFTSKKFDVKFINTDVRYLSQIHNAVNFTVKEFGKVDILVNNAAIWKMNKFFDLTEKSWDDTIDVGLKGTVFMSQAVAKQIVKQGDSGGKIVNVASIAGLSMESSYGFLIQYVAAKSGVVGISQSLARELKPLGININCVLPGGMLSPGAIHEAPTPELREEMKGHPSAPVTDPDDVARVVYMMTTGISNYMHGATVVVDGGGRLMIQK